MPWHVIKKGSSFCVAKSGSGTPIKGGCHSTRVKAVAHMKAIYANYSKKKGK